MEGQGNQVVAPDTAPSSSNSIVVSASTSSASASASSVVSATPITSSSSSNSTNANNANRMNGVLTSSMPSLLSNSVGHTITGTSTGSTTNAAIIGTMTPGHTATAPLLRPPTPPNLPTPTTNNTLDNGNNNNTAVSPPIVSPALRSNVFTTRPDFGSSTYVPENYGRYPAHKNLHMIPGVHYPYGYPYDQEASSQNPTLSSGRYSLNGGAVPPPPPPTATVTTVVTTTTTVTTAYPPLLFPPPSYPTMDASSSSASAQDIIYHNHRNRYPLANVPTPMALKKFAVELLTNEKYLQPDSAQSFHEAPNKKVLIQFKDEQITNNEANHSYTTSVLRGVNVQTTSNKDTPEPSASSKKRRASNSDNPSFSVHSITNINEESITPNLSSPFVVQPIAVQRNASSNTHDDIMPVSSIPCRTSHSSSSSGRPNNNDVIASSYAKNERRYSMNQLGLMDTSGNTSFMNDDNGGGNNNNNNSNNESMHRSKRRFLGWNRQNDRQEFAMENSQNRRNSGSIVAATRSGQNSDASSIFTHENTGNNNSMSPVSNNRQLSGGFTTTTTTATATTTTNNNTNNNNNNNGNNNGNSSNNMNATGLSVSLSSSGPATSMMDNSNNSSNDIVAAPAPSNLSLGDIDPTTLPSPTMSPITRTDPSASYFPGGNNSMNTGTLTPNNQYSPHYTGQAYGPYMPGMSSATSPLTKANMSAFESMSFSLMDLPNMVATYEAMPEPLKAYLLFQLMRRSTLPTAQFICSYTQQHIRLDFIAELPSELSLHVISFLDVNSLCRSAQVSKCWRETIDGEPSIWRKRLLDDGLCRTELEADGKLPDANLEEWEKPEYWYMGGGNSKRIMEDLEANENNIQERAKSHPIPMLMTMASMDGQEEVNHAEVDAEVDVDAVTEPTNMTLPPAQQQQHHNGMVVEPLPQAPHAIQEPMLVQAVQQEHALGQQSPMHDIQPDTHNPAQHGPALDNTEQEEQHNQATVELAGTTAEAQPEEHEQAAFGLNDEMQTHDHVGMAAAPEPEMQILEQHELPHEMPWAAAAAQFNNPNGGNANANTTNQAAVAVDDVAPVPQPPADNAEQANTPAGAAAALHSQIPNYAEFKTTTLKERYANALAAAAGKTGLLPLPNSGDDEACLKELDGGFLDVTDDEAEEGEEENAYRHRVVKKEESIVHDDLMQIDEDEMTTTFAKQQEQQEQQEQTNCIRLSPVTRHPYKRRYRRLYLLRANWCSGRARHLTFPAHGSNVVTCLHFDGRRIITGSDDNSVGVWDAATGALLRHMTGHEGGVWALAVCGDTVVSGSTDRSIRVWDIADGRCSHTLWGHTSTVRCCKIIMPRRMASGELCPRKPVIITGSRDATLRVWWLPSPRRDPPWMGMSTANGMVPVNIPQADPFLLYSWTGHTGSVRAVDGWGRWVVSGSYDSTVRVWDLLKGECRWRLSGHTQKVYSVSMMPGGEMCASGSMDGTVRVWRMSDGTCTWNLEGHTSLVGLLDLTPQQLISAAADATLRVWSLKSGESNMTLSGHTGAITCFQHDGIRIISGSDSTVKLWDQRQGRLIRDVLTGLSGVWQVRFDRRRCVAAVHRNNATWIEVLDYILGSPPLNGHQDYDESADGSTTTRRCRRNRHPSVAENVLVTQEGLTSSDNNGNTTTTTV